VNYANPTYPMIWLIDHKNEDQFNHVDGSWDDLWGGGVMLNYMSAVGPLSFGYHQSNRGSSAEWFLQLGFSL
jgi:outer membrane translocation and assembly module TamA